MILRKEDKYKREGILLFAIICLFLFVFLLPKSTIDPRLYNSSEIDSIRVTPDRTLADRMIVKKSEIYEISKQLKNSEEISADALREIDGFGLQFYLNQKIYDLRIVNSPVYGKIVSANETRYKNDSLWTLINTYYNELIEY